MDRTRSIVHHDLVTDLIQQLLKHNGNTYLIICGTRSEFLVQVSAAIHLQSVPEATRRHDLLANTIGLLANSSKVRLTFTPSLESLRSYLATLDAKIGVKEEVHKGSTSPLLVILDLVALHGSTMEFAAQGLSRTFAAAVESAYRADMDLVLCECLNAVDPSSADWGRRLWNTQVPLLNGSLRIRSEEGNWGGRGISIKQIAQRWFTFDKEIDAH
ncbi:hypothetical protein N7478_004704 [Penicillium angulare]|uniref:uncharacterized protein n=1 Tax=Penicillium angulare TaxID=116970 RepID=UPI00253FA585|nr:uncharacterized protein N7478_004704 [Penicillium angulare]KAJ5279332.1 hypothetical protein N7478_004704 [Penicillium angulare]